MEYKKIGYFLFIISLMFYSANSFSHDLSNGSTSLFYNFPITSYMLNQQPQPDGLYTDDKKIDNTQNPFLIQNSTVKTKINTIHYALNQWINPNIKSSHTSISYKQWVMSSNQQIKMAQWFNQTSSRQYHIIVNIPNYKLYLVKTNQQTGHYNILFKTKVIVGRLNDQTPLKPMTIHSLEYNPTWTPTNHMVRNHLYKNGHLNWHWLNKGRFKPYNNQGQPISWQQVKHLKIGQFRLTQPSGQDNALGQIKFVTDNSYAIYLHDTNQHYLFKYNKRAFSHGCIRVDKPFKLAALISHQSIQTIKNKINKHKTYWQEITNVPVYVLYNTIDYQNPIKSYGDPYNKIKQFQIPADWPKNLESK